MKRTDRAYLAGLIDGEGHVAISRTRTNAGAKGCKRGVSYRVVLFVAMTDRRPLDYALSLCGVGTVRTLNNKPPNKQAWRWEVWSREAAQVLKQIKPFLKVKIEAASACIEFQSMMRFPGRFGLSDAEWDAREALWRKTKVNP